MEIPFLSKVQHYSATNISATATDKSNSQLPSKVETFVLESEKESRGVKKVPIYLTDDKQPALFIYPDDITEDDIALVKHQIDGVLLRIKLESKKKEKKIEEKEEKNIGEESPT